MAAIAIVYKLNSLGIPAPGTTLNMECVGILGDPALQGDGSGNDMREISVVVPLAAASPGTWNASLKDGLIAYAAGLSPSMTLIEARCFLPVISA